MYFVFERIWRKLLSSGVSVFLFAIENNNKIHTIEPSEDSTYMKFLVQCLTYSTYSEWLWEVNKFKLKKTDISKGLGYGGSMTELYRVDVLKDIIG